MSTEVDGARGDVNVHQVVDATALNVILNLIHQKPASNVKDLNVRQIPVNTQRPHTKLLKLT